VDNKLVLFPTKGCAEYNNNRIIAAVQGKLSDTELQILTYHVSTCEFCAFANYIPRSMLPTIKANVQFLPTADLLHDYFFAKPHSSCCLPKNNKPSTSSLCFSQRKRNTLSPTTMYHLMTQKLWASFFYN
jgi:hypothetical protein